MFLSVYLLVALTQLPPPKGMEGTNELDRMHAEFGPNGYTLEWRDAEEVVRGSVTPPLAHAGDPVKVSVFVGAIDGPDFTGPVTLTLRPLGGMGRGETATVKRDEGQRNWTHEFKPSEPGDYMLEVAWFTTRRKAPRALVHIEDPRVPWWLGPVVGGALVVLALGGGLSFMTRRRGAQAAPTPEGSEAPGASPPPAEAPAGAPGPVSGDGSEQP